MAIPPPTKRCCGKPAAATTGEATPEKFATRHAAAQAALDRLSAEIRDARLDALVVFGDDQKELFLEDNIPALLVYRGKTLPHAMRPPKPEWVDWFAAIQGRYYLPSGRAEFPVEHELAEHLIAFLVRRDFDVAVCDRLPRGEGEGHAFAFVHQRLFGFGRTAPVVPMVPVFLNTYYPPNQPTPARCFRVGQAVRAAIESYDRPARVGVLGSGGLTHFAIDADFDRGIVRALQAKDAEALMRLPPQQAQLGQLGDPQLDRHGGRLGASARGVGRIHTRLSLPCRNRDGVLLRGLAGLTRPASRDSTLESERLRREHDTHVEVCRALRLNPELRQSASGHASERSRFLEEGRDAQTILTRA